MNWLASIFDHIRFGVLCASVGLCAVVSRASAAPVEGYRVVAQYPHATASYTEGLFYLDGFFYEGTGLEGHSAILAIRPETGRPILQRQLPPQYFGEGIVDWGPYLYEWTWKSHVCFVYRRSDFSPVKQVGV